MDEGWHDRDFMSEDETQIRVRDRRKSGWFRIDNVVMDKYARLMGPIGLATYAAIVRVPSGGDVSAIVSIRYLCTITGVGRTATHKAIETLERLGLIVVLVRHSDRGQHANEYIICEVPPEPRADWKEREMPPRLDHVPEEEDELPRPPREHPPFATRSP